MLSTPLKPRTHPVKVFVVKPVYVIISSSIFRRPYSLGNPLVSTTSITPSVEDAAVVSEVTPTTTCGVNWSRFKY